MVNLDNELTCCSLKHSPHRFLLVELLVFFPLSKIHPKVLLSQLQKAMVLFGYSNLQRGLVEMGVVQELVGIIKFGRVLFLADYLEDDKDCYQDVPRV
jgi:hypothetical protein